MELESATVSLHARDGEGAMPYHSISGFYVPSSGSTSRSRVDMEITFFQNIR